MKLKVNGEIVLLKEEPNPPNLSSIINLLNHNPRLIVVEFNGVILPPTQWNKQKVKDGDNLEIVTIVGGGS